MKVAQAKGFTLLEVLVAFVVAALSISWFFYVLSHGYYTTSRLLERLRIFDTTTPFRVYIAHQLSSDLLNPSTLQELEDDELALSEYTIPRSKEISLKIDSREEHLTVYPADDQIVLKHLTICLGKGPATPHNLWEIYVWPKEHL